MIKSREIDAVDMGRGCRGGGDRRWRSRWRRWTMWGGGSTKIKIWYVCVITYHSPWEVYSLCITYTFLSKEKERCTWELLSSPALSSFCRKGGGPLTHLQKPRGGPSLPLVITAASRQAPVWSPQFQLPHTSTHLFPKLLEPLTSSLPEILSSHLIRP